jgi:hypothetical protein
MHEKTYDEICYTLILKRPEVHKIVQNLMSLPYTMVPSMLSRLVQKQNQTDVYVGVFCLFLATEFTV